MITVGMNYHTLPGKQQDFEEKFSAVIGALRAAPGHGRRLVPHHQRMVR
jgi:heme-degrading monooxygenase HmoA